MDAESDVARRNGNVLTAAIGAAVLACFFVPLGMQAKGEDLAGMCEGGNFMHGLSLVLGWMGAVALALIIFIGSVIASIVRHSGSAFWVGAVISVAAPVAFAVGIAIASTSPSPCVEPPRLTEPPSAPAVLLPLVGLAPRRPSPGEPASRP